MLALLAEYTVFHNPALAPEGKAMLSVLKESFLRSGYDVITPESGDFEAELRRLSPLADVGLVIAPDHLIKAKNMIGKRNYEYAIPFYGARRPTLIDLMEKSDQSVANSYRYFKRNGNLLYAEDCFDVKGETRWFWFKAWKEAPGRAVAGTPSDSVPRAPPCVGAGSAAGPAPAASPSTRGPGPGGAAAAPRRPC